MSQIKVAKAYLIMIMEDGDMMTFQQDALLPQTQSHIDIEINMLEDLLKNEAIIHGDNDE